MTSYDSLLAHKANKHVDIKTGYYKVGWMDGGLVGGWVGGIEGRWEG